MKKKIISTLLCTAMLATMGEVGKVLIRVMGDQTQKARQALLQR